MRKILFAAFVLLAGLCASAQTQINPTNQVNWPLTTITGSDTPIQACASTNYNQPFLRTDVTPNKFGTCGADGWQYRGTSATAGSAQSYSSCPATTGSSGQLMVMTVASTCAMALPAVVAGYGVAVQRTSSSTVSIAPPGGVTLYVAGTSTASLTIPNGQTVYVTTDGTSYYATAPAVAGSGVTITPGATGNVFAASSSMVYPGAGIANSTGSAWGTSYSSSNQIPTNILGSGTPGAGKYIDGAAGVWTTLPGAGGGSWSSLTNPTTNLALTMGGNLSKFSFTHAMTGTSVTSFNEWNGNSTNATTLWQASQGSVGVVNAVSGLATVPNTATIHQVNGLWGGVSTASVTTAAVGGYFEGFCNANSTLCWGDNPWVGSAASLTGATMIGSEVDVNANNTGDSITGIFVNGAWGAQPNNAYGVVVNCTACATKQWQVGYATADGRISTAAFQAGRAAATGATGSQSITLVSSATGTGSQANTIAANSAGDIILTPNSGTTSTPGLKVSGITGGNKCLQADTAGVVSGTVAACLTNPMTTMGDAMYGGSSGVVTRLAGPTTSGHLFLFGWTPSGSAIAPTAYDFGANAATYVKGTSPIVATQNANDVTISCPTCGTSSSTAVNNNGASTLGTSQQDGMLPYICADSSGSGTAQSCNTATSFTVTSGNCFIYKTTTTNSGTGLTVNANSLGAKSVAIPGASGWTTTLTASIIPANKPLTMCYDGTNLNVQQTGTASSGASYPTAESHTASSSASLDFTTCMAGSNRDYVLRFSDVIPASTSANLLVQVSSNGGSSYDTSTTRYVMGYTQVGLLGSNAFSGTPNTSGNAGFWIGGYNSTTAETVDGTMSLFNMTNSTASKHGWYYGTGDNGASGGSTVNTAGYVYTPASSSAINAVRVIASTGNIASGVVTCQPLP